MFIIEDTIHAEIQEGEYKTLDEACAELMRRVLIPWDEAPNRAPCTNWRNCGRSYYIIEYDTSGATWKKLRSIPALEISAGKIRWLTPNMKEILR